MEMNGYEKLSICRPRHRGWLRGGIVSGVTDMNGYGGCPIVIRGTADGCRKKMQCHPRHRGAVQEQDEGRQYPSWCYFKVNAVHHIRCPGHADQIMGIFVAR